MLLYLHGFAFACSSVTMVCVIYRAEKLGPEMCGIATISWLSLMVANIANLILPLL